MIRINLLGRERPKIYRPIQITGPWVGVLFLLPVIVAGMILYVDYARVTDDNKVLQIKIDDYDKSLLEMAKLQEEMKKIEAEETKVRARITVIEDLKRSQSGPALLLDALGRGVGRTETVWLTELTERPGGQIEIKGHAGSVEAVANLITNIGQSKYFSDVAFKESKQVKSGQTFEGTFVFTLTTVFAIPVPESEQTPPAAAGATSGTAGR